MRSHAYAYIQIISVLVLVFRVYFHTYMHAHTQHTHTYIRAVVASAPGCLYNHDLYECIYIYMHVYTSMYATTMLVCARIQIVVVLDSTCLC